MVLEFDPGSFRDPDGRICERDGRVFRILSASALTGVQSLFSEGHLPEFINNSWVIPTSLKPAVECGFAESDVGKFVLEHDLVPVVNYAYEWPFQMLKDAALLTLDLLEGALSRGLTLKDATPYNIMFTRGKLQFIDVLSLTRYDKSMGWRGQSQFFQLFLYPLLLTSLKNIEFQPWLRGSLTGLSSATAAKLFGMKCFTSPILFKYAYLPHLLERLLSNSQGNDFKQLPAQPIDLVKSGVKKLRSTMSRLNYSGDKGSVWSSYITTNDYTEIDKSAKATAITNWIQSRKIKTLTDIGGNTGEYSLPHAKSVDYVVTLDFDPACINRLYQQVQEKKISNYLPLVMDFNNPSSANGWNFQERKSISERLRGDAFLALALVHHICLANSVPLSGFSDALKKYGTRGIVEWVDPTDPMAEKILHRRNANEAYLPYNWDEFLKALETDFNVTEVIQLPRNSRRLCCIELK